MYLLSLNVQQKTPKSAFVKNLCYFFILVFFLTSCTSLKKVSHTSSPPADQPVVDSKPRFIENISINNSSATTYSADKLKNDNKVIQASNTAVIETNLSNHIESRNARLFRYSILLDLPIEELTNEKLFEFMDEWYGIPYRYGGTTKKGIDCSAFSSMLFAMVYGITIPRNSREQFAACERIGKNELSEGDLVFFTTRNRISHVGVYIGNNKFVHASTSNGVMISDLNEDYYSKKYSFSGRVKSNGGGAVTGN